MSLRHRAVRSSSVPRSAAVFRWLHILVGVTWIGLLYYFNLVQVPAFAAFGDEATARNIALDKVARRALWWFRWAALSTFVIGLLITSARGLLRNDFGKRATGLAISTGMLLGIIMMLNVWGVIWRNQKVVLANAANVVAGGEADPAAAAAGRKALLASRQNTIFSVSMLYFMVFTSHGDASRARSSAAARWRPGCSSPRHHRRARAQRPRPVAVEEAPNKGLNILYDGPACATSSSPPSACGSSS